MQVAGRSLVIVTLVSTQLLLSGVPEARAFIAEQLGGYTLHYYTDVDGFQVSSHYATYGLKMENDVTMRFQYGHDVVTFPAIDAPVGSQEAVDAITTASRPITGNTDPFQDFVKVRDEVTGTIAFRGYSASYYVSTESDYFAQMVSLSYNRGFIGENLNLAAGASYSWDKIEPLADDDTDGLVDYRRTLHWNFVATQTMTPTTVMRVGAEFNRVKGLQHDAYRNVYVAGGNLPELHPNDRNRRDFFVNVSQYITNRSSIKVDYRYYDDDWGVTSHTIGGKLSQYVTDEFVIRYRYRYYTQVPAFFFREEYVLPGGIGGFRTGDYRLGDYGGHLFGGQFLWFPHGALGSVGFLRNANLVFSYERYFNTNNFSADIIETGMQVTF